MRAIIVDDEADGIRTLRKVLEINCSDVDIVATCSDASTAIAKLAEFHPDVVFLDIRMPGKSGLDMLAELKEIDFQVIFVTAHDEYMLQALQFSAIDYLMKPVEEDRLIEAVERVKKRMQSNKTGLPAETLLYNMRNMGMPMEMRLCLPTLKGFNIVKLEEIVYCEAKRSYTMFHLMNKSCITISKPLFDYDRLLSGTAFLRIHKSFLINIMHVTEYTRGDGGTVIMSNGMTIEVSRRKKEQFLGRIKDIFKY